MNAAIIVVAQRKGGAGKTTLAAHLGAAWAGMGRNVALIDTDAQASLTRWHQNRAARLGGSTGLGFAAVTGWQAPGEMLRRARDCDILLVDSPSSGESEVRMAMRCAGLVMIPVQPSPVDVWATLPTLDMAQREGVPALLVLNRVPARAALTQSMREQLALYDAGLAATSIGNRVAFAAAFAEGWGITECAEGSSAAEEIAALAGELVALLPSSEQVRPRPELKAPPLPSPERPVFAVEKTKPDDVVARQIDTRRIENVIDDLNVLELTETVPPVQAYRETSTANWMLREDQLRAGIASLKRRLARRAK
ncbi:MAG TPA: ParA family partition ATPase [Stellaceae bacterium]|nr:ParA family partition ATPase [Stellaceae bacterium]